VTIDRDCFEYLRCPGCQALDLDFEFLDYRLVRCSFCSVVVRVTNYEVFIGPPEDPTDHVGYLGAVHAT
jgi:hypothetical protein